jgi:CheY-like chemotaxis protein
VLLTEDDEDVRSVFETVLGDRYDLMLAESGEQALALARGRRPDVVLLDWTLPDVTGAEFLQRLRALGPGFPELPIVVVSGTTSLREIARSVGAIACPKPCDVEQLTKAIEHALGRGAG